MGSCRVSQCKSVCRCGWKYRNLQSLLQNEHCYENYHDSHAVQPFVRSERVTGYYLPVFSQIVHIDGRTSPAVQSIFAL